MCDSQLENEIKNVMDDFISHGTQFTAFDITKQIRQTLPKTPHHEVRGIVRQAWRNGGFPVDYTRTMIMLTSGEQSFLYSPINLKPEDYYAAKDNPSNIGVTSSDDSEDSEDDLKSPTKVIKTPMIQVMNVVKATSSGTPIRPDRRKRICIPSKMAKSIGLSRKEVAYVLLDQNNKLIEIVSSVVLNKNNQKSMKAYVVDKHNNIRIPSATIAKAGISENAVCMANIVGSKIVLKEQ